MKDGKDRRRRMNRGHRNGAGCCDASDDSSDDSDALVNRITRDLIAFAQVAASGEFSLAVHTVPYLVEP
jgi:hypothetical protein